MDEKFTLGLDFPNLPYIIDAEKDVKLTQSMAIMRYVAGEIAPELLKRASQGREVAAPCWLLVGPLSSVSP
jgi:glutathione S-transferase